ncbi:hypothetical protein KKF61_07055, partial [Patescibacteria group bacterium]|nr:hypothetical protein [Patescibacteria group bacterium]
QGTSLGIDWLHEMVSDFGAPELLEQAGLKSTASVNLFTKLANHVGNRRGIAHQAPLLRAIQQLGIHTIKDYATSHISYTPLPLELKRAPRMTNFEAITDAAVKDDTESVALYLAKLHPRDLGQFFEIIDANSYYDLSKFSPKRETKREIAARVKVLVNQRLVSEGMSENEIKLFFLSTTRNGSLLSPTFKNVAEVESCAALAEQMFQKKTVNNATQKLFGRNRNSDPLENLVHFVQYRFDDFTDKNAVFLTDVDSIAQFIGTVNKLIKGELPQVKEGYFIDLEGGVSKHAYNRSAQIHEDLKYILFGYIERYYLSDIPDGELDQEQIENIFQAVKSAGFEYLPNSYYFPILEENIGPANRQIIESAYSKVYGRELVRHSSGKDIEPLPTPADFRNQIKGKSPMDIIRLLNRHARNYELDLETKAQYVQAGLEYFEEYDFTRSHLAALIKNQIGNETMGNWQKYEDPKWNTTDSIRTNPEDSFTGTSRQEEKSHPRKLTLDDLIQEFGLDHTTLYAEARRKGEIERISSEIKFVADTIASSEETLFDFVESIMRNIRTDIKTLDQYQLLAICRPLFMLASKEEGGTTSEEDRIRDFDRFYQLRLIQEIVQRIENVRFENVQDLSSYIRETKRKYSQSPTNIRFALYEDSVYSVLLAKPVRDELRRLTEPG